MPPPIEKPPEPRDPTAPPVALDDDASLSVDQVSEDPPEAGLILASPCPDALLQAAPCPHRNRPPLPPLGNRASKPATSRSASSRTARPATRTPRPARVTGGAIALPKGELASLDSAGSSSSDMLADGCGERGPRLVIAGRDPDVIEPDWFEVSVPIEVSPSIPIVVSEPPPRASAPPRSAPAPTSARPALARPTPAPARVTLTPAKGAEPGRQESQPPPLIIDDSLEPPSLDPLQSLDIPRKPPPARPRRPIPARMVAILGGVFGLSAIGMLVAFLIQLDGPRGAAPAASSARATAKAAPRASRPDEPASSAPAPAPAPPPEPGPWRVSSLSSDDGVKVISGKLGTKSLTTALEDEHIPKPQIARILKAFDDTKLFDKPKKSHQFVVALDRASKRVKGFEYQAASTDVWQAREVEDGRLVGSKLDLKIEQRRVARAIVVKDDLKSAIVEAGLDDDLISLLDDALSDRISLGRLGKGAALRVVVQEQLAAGRFSKYLGLDAVEYTLPGSSKRSRIYHLRGGKVSGYFDGNGKAPFRASWGPPLKVVRVTSRFNPKRLHPVLHTVMPHNGTDFGAPTGTPVYAVAAGTVEHIGPQGPSGNLVLIEHPGAIQSGYAHLSKFAPNLKKGDKVESQQLVGYVGSTGRSTGPHLHFSIKKNGVFIDALTVIKLNQERVIPKAEREPFDAFKAEMDRLFDGIPLPDQPGGAGAEAGAEPDEEPREENNHGEEEHVDPAPSASGSATPRPSEPPPAPAVTDDTSPESAVWRPD